MEPLWLRKFINISNVRSPLSDNHAAAICTVETPIICCRTYSRLLACFRPVGVGRAKKSLSNPMRQISCLVGLVAWSIRGPSTEGARQSPHSGQSPVWEHTAPPSTSGIGQTKAIKLDGHIHCGLPVIKGRCTIDLRHREEYVAVPIDKRRVDPAQPVISNHR